MATQDHGEFLALGGEAVVVADRGVLVRRAGHDLVVAQRPQPLSGDLARETSVALNSLEALDAEGDVAEPSDHKP
jgi:hypothetical protein